MTPLTPDNVYGGPRAMDVNYDKARIIRAVHGLHVWQVIGYNPTVAEFNTAVWVPEEVYVDTLLRFLVGKARERLVAETGEAPNDVMLHRLLVEEYFGLKDGTLYRMVMTLIRLRDGRAPKGPQTVPSTDIQWAIRNLIDHGVPSET